MKPVLDWTIREWFEYHQKKVHQGSINGFPQHQQKWMGRTIWKNPLDCWIYQEILFETRPEVIVELGVAHGGNALYMAHLMDLLGIPNGTIVGVDLDLQRAAGLKHPRIQLIQGNCQDLDTVGTVARIVAGRRAMVISDCGHSAPHVLAELKTYSPLVSVGCYHIVEDGICDVMRWPPVPGPASASAEWQKSNPHFANDADLREKYLITYNFNGFLKRVR